MSRQPVNRLPVQSGLALHLHGHAVGGSGPRPWRPRQVRCLRAGERSPAGSPEIRGPTPKLPVSSASTAACTLSTRAITVEWDAGGPQFDLCGVPGLSTNSGPGHRGGAALSRPSVKTQSTNLFWSLM